MPKIPAPIVVKAISQVVAQQSTKVKEPRVQTCIGHLLVWTPQVVGVGILTSLVIADCEMNKAVDALKKADIKSAPLAQKFAAGSFAGFLTAGVLQPFDAVKVTQQALAEGSKEKVTMQEAARRLWQQGGGVKGVYGGALYGALGQGYRLGLGLVMKDVYNTWFKEQGISGKELFAAKFVTGFGVGSAIELSLLPAMTFKNRAALNASKGINHDFFKMCQVIMQDKGVHGFFKGGIATCIRKGAGVGIPMAFIDDVSKHLQSEFGYNKINADATALASLSLALEYLTNPFDRVRVVQQTSKMPISTKDAFKEVFSSFSDAFRGAPVAALRKMMIRYAYMLVNGYALAGLVLLTDKKN